MKFSRCRLVFELLGCFLVAKITQADSVEIVTPEVFVATTVRTTTVRTNTVTPVTPKPTSSTHNIVPQKVKLGLKNWNKNFYSGNKSFEWPTNDTYVQAYVNIRRKTPAKRNDQYGLPEKSYNTVLKSSAMSEYRYPSLTSGPTTIHPSVLFRGPFAPQPFASPTPYGPFIYQSEDVGANWHWYNKPYSSSSSSMLQIFSKKLSLSLLFKIILKLALFKLLIKFIAVICILLFFPKEEKQQEMGDYRMRRVHHLNNVSNRIWEGIIKKENLYGFEKDEESHEDHEDDFDVDEKGMMYIKQIVDLASSNPPSSISRLQRAVVFLTFCVNLVDSLVGHMRNYLQSANSMKKWFNYMLDKMKIIDRDESTSSDPLVDLQIHTPEVYFDPARYTCAWAGSNETSWAEKRRR